MYVEFREFVHHCFCALSADGMSYVTTSHQLLVNDEMFLRLLTASLFLVGFPSTRAISLSSLSQRNHVKCFATKALDFLGDMHPTLEADNRPHEQRAAGPRAARRLNHAFKYLYRHNDGNYGEDNLSSHEFLERVVGYSKDQILDMNQTFPPLLEMDVPRHLRPKLRFLLETCDATLQEVRECVPPQYFGARLERIIAPRHAFLVHKGLPHGRQLMENPKMWQDFLVACRKPKQFCALCNQWQREHGPSLSSNSTNTVKQIEAFDTIFQRGLMPAARDELCQWNNTWPLEHLDISAGELIALLIRHGANPLERDARGATLLHWAAGTGNLGGVQELLPHFQEDGVFVESERDGATPLHWAAAGANAREFGIGGHPEVCQYLVNQVEGSTKKKLINRLTKDGNSVLMWSAWSGTEQVVKLLVRNRADATVTNRNGCTVAHWAASGGNLAVCRYLTETVGIDFTQPNHGGNTPLTHAVAFGRVEVVEWLRNEITQNQGDSVAAALAKEFVDWTKGEDGRRKQVLRLFEDWFGHEESELTTDEEHEIVDVLL